MVLTRQFFIYYRKLDRSKSVSLALSICLLILYCEVIVYYLVILQCTWPEINRGLEGDGTIDPPDERLPLRMMLLADTHLLGPKTGNWFDKLRREWQMYRAFQTAMLIHKPDAVAFLGDIFDEGHFSDDWQFKRYMERFYDLFYVPEGTRVLTAVGNHDVGFHYRMFRHFTERFDSGFNTSSVQLTVLNGNIFVTINSMAMHGDGCNFCQEAEYRLDRLSKMMQCSQGQATTAKQCERMGNLPGYSRPILLQHFPLYRTSDASCTEPDAAPAPEKHVKFREKWECLSKAATRKLLRKLKPRVAFSGHTHHGCLVVHEDDIPEWTLPSFSWRNKNNPSFALAVFTPTNFSVNKCYLPLESTVINTYVLGTAACVVGWYIVFFFSHAAKS